MSNEIEVSDTMQQPAHKDLHGLFTQYRQVIFRPAVSTFISEKQHARWKSVWLQLIVLGIVSAALSLVTTLISPSQLPPIAGMNIATERLVLNVFSFVFIIILTPLSFFFASLVLYGLGHLLRGHGTYLQQSYTLSLIGVPMVLLSSLLQLIPSTATWLPYIPHLYSVFLTILSMQAVHSFKRKQFIAVTVIICAVTALFGLLLLYLSLTSHG